MSGVVVLDDTGRAVIFNRATGDVLSCSVPTALENVALSGGVWIHGRTGDRLKDAKPQRAATVDPVIPLTEPDMLSLPEPVEEAPPAAPAPVPAAKTPRAPKAADPERAAVIAELKARDVKYFAGATTEKLKEILAAA